MSLKGTALVLALLIPMAAHSQGHLSGSLESSSIYDDENGSPYQGFHSNNYLRLNYTSGRFDAGLQAEWYPSPLPGYDLSLQGIGLPLKYVSWDGGSWKVTAGDFYDQFGSGLVLRSWEDRDLGLANSIGGIRFSGSFWDDRIGITVLSGAPHQGMGYAKSWVNGADVNLSLGGFLLGASFVGRTEQSPDQDFNTLLNWEEGCRRQYLPNTVFMLSGRASWTHSRFSANAEYVIRSLDFTTRHSKTGLDDYGLEQGTAFLGNLAYSGKTVSARVTYRYLYNMDFSARRTLGTKSISNTLNYLPALCLQQTYMLACLNPYETYSEGESGFAGVLYYHPVKGLSLRIGGSWIDALGKVLPLRETNYLAYRDIYAGADYRWSRKLKTTLYVSIQENSPTHGNRKATNAQNVFVLDGQYKFSSKYSIHAELQYLYSQELTKDWMAGLLEFNMSPNWSFSISDMYNHGSTKDHYWNVGATFNYGSFKVMAGYGRNREGMVCSGGVCRYQPEYKGAFIKVNWLF